MSTSFILTSGIIVAIIFIFGVLYTIKEFKKMDKNPEEFRKDTSDEPDVVDKEDQ